MKNLIYISIITAVISCQSEKATQNISKVNSPFEKPLKNVDVPIQKNLVNSIKGDTLFLANDTRIIIPENAFVDSLGNPIKGEVEINFQEYHTEAEVILSGIPMQYDSAGTEYTLETDGMFKVSGEQNGSKVGIAPNKSLRVKTQSYKEDTPCFNYYTQNEKGDWNYKLTKERKVNTEKLIEQEVAKIKPIDEKSVGIDFRINTNKNPELAEFKNISWIYNGNEPDTLNFKLLSKIRWNDFDLKKTNESLYSYLLVGKQKKNEFVMPVTLAFSEEELATVKTLITKRIKEEELAYAKLQSEYEREAVINNFGVHNWDRYSRDQYVEVPTILEFDKEISHFYVVNLNTSTNSKIVNCYKDIVAHSVIPNSVTHTYKKSDYNTFKTFKKGSDLIIAFLEEEGKVAYWRGKLGSNDTREVIDLTEHKKTIKKPADLQELIDLT